MHRTIAVCLFTLTACAVAVPTAARNTNGRWNYLAADMREWFKGLHAQRNGIVCCDEADGWRVDDVDWESKDGHYRVRLYGEWVPVPDETVVTEPRSLRSCGGVAVFRHRWDNAGPLLLTGGGRIIVREAAPTCAPRRPRVKRTRRTWRPFKAHRTCSGTLAICTCKYLGHRNIKNTVRYTELSPARFKDFWRR